jgi:fucose 4-O-acetylase-like acetyltransferase
MDAPNPDAAGARAGERDSTRRDPMLDAGRGIAIALVLYSHQLQTFFMREDSIFVTSAFEQWRVIYSFHMPLFFLISGAAHRASEQRRSPHRPKASFLDAAIASTKLLVLAYAHHIVASVLRFAIAIGALNPGSLHWFVRTTVKPLITGFDFRLSVLWFLVVLAIVQFLAFAWTNTRNVATKVAIGAICVTSFVAGTDLGTRIPNWYTFKAWACGLIFFALGRRLAAAERYLSIWTAALCALAVIALVPLNHGCTFSLNDLCGQTDLKGRAGVAMIDGQFGFLPLFYPTAILGSVVVMALARWKPVAPLRWLGRRSLQLFLINGYYLAFFEDRMARWVHVSSLGALEYVLIFSAALGAHCLVLLILQRPLLSLQIWSARLVDRTVQRITSQLRVLTPSTYGDG